MEVEPQSELELYLFERIDQMINGGADVSKMIEALERWDREENEANPLRGNNEK